MPLARTVEPRVTTIEGRRVLVVDRTPPLPKTLDWLLRAMRVTWRQTVHVAGTRTICESEQDHRLSRFVEGRYAGPDGYVRDLRLLMCIDCESVCVRDITTDILPTDRRRPARRRDHVIGWYSGARRNQRQYR
jgi:hypothetical protein